MNSSDDRKTDLLAETFAGDWTHGPAAGFARAAAAHARRRRTLRRAAVASATAAAVLVLTFAVLLPHHATSPAAAPPAQTSPRAYEIISDAELIATIDDRPLLVIAQPDGTRKIVALD